MVMVMNESAFLSAMGPMGRSIVDFKEAFAQDQEMLNCITNIQSNMNEMQKIFDAKYKGKESSH